METNTVDNRAAITVKKACLARSGIYLYSRDEMAARGIKMPVDKEFYREYRPASVLVKAKDKFALCPVPCEHPSVDIDSGNFHSLASGVTGDAIEIEAMDNGEVGLYGNIAFFTKEAYDHYMSGSKDTSAGYVSSVKVVKNADEVGYDLILEDIKSVNHIAVVSHGRGGHEVRVCDSVPNKPIGGLKMKKGLLNLLGVGKTQEGGKFSDALFASLGKVKTLDSVKMEEEIASVTQRIAGFGDSEAKEVLAGAVADCFKTPDAVLAEKEKVADTIDALFAKCEETDKEAVARILDACGKEKDKECPECGAEKGPKGEKCPECGSTDKKSESKDADGEEGKEKGEDKEEKKTADASEIASLIDKAVEKALGKVADSIDAKVEDAIKKALGDGVSSPKGQEVANTTDSAADEDVSFLVRGVFGA